LKPEGETLFKARANHRSVTHLTLDADNLSALPGFASSRAREAKCGSRQTQQLQKSGCKKVAVRKKPAYSADQSRVLIVEIIVNQCRSQCMFSFLRADPLKKLNKAYQKKLGEALQAQRNGNIRGYSLLTEEAEALWAEIQALQAKN
jgi:hypothetical protein